mgnify:CR=1 FL=1
MGKEILKMEHITKIYPNGVMANRDVSFSVREGEIHALMGENGAGKSTLMKILFGDEDATEGDIIFEGNKIQPKSAADTIRLGIGMVHQHFMLVDSLRVYENVILGMEPKNGIMIDKEKAIRAVEETAKKYNLKIDPMAVVGDLSVSQKQKVEILKVLLRGAKLLILDEPTAGLDPKGRDDILGLVQKLHNEQGLTIILVSHSMEDVARYVSRLVVMNHGEKVFDGTPKEVFRHYKELEAIGLAAPQITYVVHKLIDKGIPLDPDITTVEEAKNAILKIWREKNGKSSVNAAQVSTAGADSENAGHGNAAGTASGNADITEKTAGEEKTC